MMLLTGLTLKNSILLPEEATWQTKALVQNVAD